MSNVHVRLEVSDEHGAVGAAFGAVLPALRVSDIAPEARSVERSGSKRALVTAAAQLLVRKCVSVSGLAAYLTEPQADDGEGGRIGTVDISTTKVAEKGGRKKGVAGGHVGMEVDPVVAED